MKDILKRIIIGFVCLWFIWYLLFLYTNNSVIVLDYFQEWNFWYYVVLLLAFIYVFVFFSLFPMYFTISKSSLFVLWIALIVLWDTVLVNTIEKNIFLWDFIKIIWVFFTLTAFTNLFFTSKMKKQKESSKIEIIEI